MSSNRYAFFDVDGTILSVKSMFSFQSYYYRHAVYRRSWFGAVHDRLFHLGIRTLNRLGCTREFVNRTYYLSYRGRQQQVVQRCAERWYLELKRSGPSLLLANGMEALRRHQAEGVEVVFVSGSAPEILAPLAKELGITTMLATRLEVRGDRYTGRIQPPQTIGEGKREAILAFLRERGTCPRDCFAYGDHISDLPMLEAVGNASVVPGDGRLEHVAVERGWEILANTYSQ